MAAPATLDVGDVYPFALSTTDADGNPANVGAISLTITKPDGTTETPTITNPPATTGTYIYDYLTTQAGRHTYRWLATGANAAAYADGFNVIDSTWTAIVGLAEAKSHLGIAATDTSQDEKLRGFILSASAVVEGIVGPIARKTVTETHHGGYSAIALRQTPVISVTSVTENGSAVASSDYSLSDAGVLWRASNYASTTVWRAGVNNVTVTYVVGRTIVQPNIIDGTKDLIRINWRPQQGGNYAEYDQGISDDYGTTRDSGEVRLGFFVPYTVMQRLSPDDLPDGFA